MTEPKRGIVLAEVVASGLALGLSVIDRLFNTSQHPVFQRLRDLRPTEWPSERVAREIEERMAREKAGDK